MTAPDENSSSHARPSSDMHAELYGDVAHAERFLQAEPLAQHIVDWLNQPSLRAERRYLEARTVLIGPTAMQTLHALAITYAELPDMVEDVMDHMDLIADIQARGNDAEAIQQAYLNAFGGVVLDAPPWVEEAERQEVTIEHNERHAQSSDGAARARVEVWRTAFARSRETSTLPSDLRAYILTRLWNALDDTDGPDKASVQEQGIVCLDRALRIYTRERLPRQWATVHNNLGLTYAARINGDRRHNLERALAHYRAALEERTFTTLPYEWAMTQNNLAVAYSHRIADDRRLNQERAIACYEAALKAFTRERYPMEWASIQQNLGTLFSARLEGNSGINTESAIKHYEAALEVMAAQQALSERARTTANLASAYLDRVKGSRAANIQTAIMLLEDALTIRKRDSNPSQWANVQELLGESYRELGQSQSVDATAQAVACYRAALAVYTRHTFPLDWGRVMNGLGLVWMDRQLGGRDNNLAKAAKCFRMALKACTASAAPIAHRRIALNLAEAEATLGRWEVAHAAYAQALSVERALFQAGIGIRGKDAAVTEAREAATRNGYALTHLSRLREAITALEHGRTRVLAQARLLASADPQRIRNPSLRQRYVNARNTLREAYVAVGVDGVRAELSERGRHASTDEDAYRTAQSAFDSLVAEIRAAHDPADFLDEAVDDELIARAVWNGSQKRAAVYLLATPWGGMALGVFPIESVESPRFRVDALELPQLTSVFVDDLLEVSVGDDATTIVGGYTWAQEFHGLELLLNDNADESKGETESRGETIERCVEGMRGACDRAQRSSALVDAVRHVTANTKLGPLLRQSIAELSIIDRRALNVMVGQAFLERELDRCLPQLCESALTPIARWLRDNDITSVGLIPCGALGVLPLATLLSSLMAADEVAGQEPGSSIYCGISVTPSLRAIAQQEHYDIVKRSGVYALGDPTSSKQGGSLRWGNAEARAIAALGGMAHQFAVQQDADREWLLVTLRKALVIDIACHGEFDYQDPLHSRILLARGESVTLNDLLGGAADVHGLRLVMLSSCQSGVGDVRRTRDEMHSLAVGMLQAGAQAVLAALWPVDDRATFLLMTRFAHEWLHDMECPPALALARAQQWLRVQSFADLGGWESRLRGAMSVLDGDPIPPTYSPDEVEIRGLGYRLSLAEADQRIRDVADLKVAQGYASLRPYEHPTHWAAFQVFGA